MDDLIKVNGNEFGNHYNEIYPTALIFKNAIYFNYRDYREDFITPTDLHLYIKECQIQTVGHFLCDAVY